MNELTDQFIYSLDSIFNIVLTGSYKLEQLSFMKDVTIHIIKDPHFFVNLALLVHVLFIRNLAQNFVLKFLIFGHILVLKVS